MNVLVTGADKIWGYLTAEMVLEHGVLHDSKGQPSPIDSMILVIHENPYEAEILADTRVRAVIGSITDKPEIESIILDNEIQSIFHFETITRDREEGPLDFDHMYGVNVYGTLNILEACRKRGTTPKFVFCSSSSVFRDREPVITDDLRRVPSCTYGTTKAIDELLIADYSRHNFVDGRSSILPMCVSWRPSVECKEFLFSVFDEPFNGQEIPVPLKRETKLYLNGYWTCITNLIETHEIDREALGEDRAILQRGIAPTISEMLEGFQRIAGERNITMGQAVDRLEPEKQAEFDLYNKDADSRRAREFKLSTEDLDTMIRRYLDDYLKVTT